MEKETELAWEMGELGCIPQRLWLIRFRTSGSHLMLSIFTTPLVLYLSINPLGRLSNVGIY